MDTERLNVLMNLVGELVTSRTIMSNRILQLGNTREELTARKDRLLDLVRDFQRKHEFGESLGGRAIRQESSGKEMQFSDLEFDRYDDFNILSRGLIEITSDVSEIMNQLDSFFTEVDEESANFAKVTSNMQYEVTQVRMVSAGTLFDRLQRPIRDAARTEGKQVNVTCIGTNTELDKSIIDDLFDPFLHLVRNAVSHGIESVDDRLRAGKPEAGTLLLNAFQEGNSVIIEVHDDGCGVNLERVRQRALEQGFLSPGDSPTEDELLRFIFRSGFSTRDEVSSVSGRGVGMDAVATAIQRLNGTVSLQTAPETGTRLTVRLPLTLAINQALMVRVGSETFAIPLNFVEETLFAGPGAVENVGGAEVLLVRGSVVPVLRLGDALACNGEETSSVAVIVKAESRRVALFIDRAVGRQEIVVKNCGGFLGSLSHIAGATTGGDGRIHFILDVSTLMGLTDRVATEENLLAERALDDAAPDNAEQEIAKQSAAPAARKRAGKWILVVDDSISVRKFASRLLESAGYNVDVAVDGLNALEFLRENRYDAMVSDLEMPRMHGYELIAEARRAPATKTLPIVVVTSRSGEKHVSKALEVGADEVLGKPFTQNDLLESLTRITSTREAVTS